MSGIMYERLGFIKNASGVNSKEAAANVTRLLKRKEITAYCRALQSFASQ